MALAAAGLFVHGLPAQSAAPNIIYTASGTFAQPALSGPDPLGLAGQPFSINILADEALKPTQHNQSAAQYDNLWMYALTSSTTIPGNPLEEPSNSLTLTLEVGASGEPDEMKISFPLLPYYGLNVTVTAKAKMPAGTITSTKIRPFTAPVALMSEATVTYTGPYSTTTLAIASGALDTAPETEPGLTPLYNFTGQNGDALNPTTVLAVAPDGKLYGTTPTGGTYNFGAVFELMPPSAPGEAWAETVIHSFTGSPDGAGPLAGLVIGKNGALYGTANWGGTYDGGAVFQLKPPDSAGGSWTETLIYNFTTSNDAGIFPAFVGLVMDDQGVLYGATSFAGELDRGAIFALRPPTSAGGTWTEKTLYSFGALPDDAENPTGLVVGTGGVLYGTTQVGGPTGSGTVFQLIPPKLAGGSWAESFLYDFSGQNGDGSLPEGGVVIGKNGELYGTTESGGASNRGAVFELTPPAVAGGAWSESILYSFTGENGDGSNPVAGLAMDDDGALYGTTLYGGAALFGTVYKLSPPSAPGTAWTETQLASLSDPLFGATPVAGLVFEHNGDLYGAMELGGDPFCANYGGMGCGTVFKMLPRSGR